MTKFCNHVAVAHKQPEHFTDAYDNLTLLIASMKALFRLISEVSAGHLHEVSNVAGLGEDLCEELERRAKLLDEFNTADDPATTTPGKEG